MHQLKHLAGTVSMVMALALAGRSLSVSARPLEATSPVLGAAGSYSVLGATTVTNTGSTTTTGDVGVSPGTSITGFPPGIAGPPGTIHSNDMSAINAQAANLTIFGALSGQPCTANYPDVTDLTLISPLLPGVYCSAGSFSLSGNLVLTGTGVWIFKMVSALNTFSGSSVTGGDPCNVWWRVGSSAVIGTNAPITVPNTLITGTNTTVTGTNTTITGTTAAITSSKAPITGAYSIVGNILALTSISLNTNASVNGRVLAQTGAVTLDSNTINSPICAAAVTPTPTATATNVPPAPRPTSKPTDRPMPTLTPVPTVTPVQSPTVTPTPTLLPAVVGLPKTGGAPLRNDDLPWSLVFVAGIGAIATLLGVRAYRRNRMPKQ